jgi:hypothetical protein
VLSGLFCSGATFGGELTRMRRPPSIALGGCQSVKVWLDRKEERPFDALPAGRDGSDGYKRARSVTDLAATYHPALGPIRPWLVFHQGMDSYASS